VRERKSVCVRVRVHVYTMLRLIHTLRQARASCIGSRHRQRAVAEVDDGLACIDGMDEEPGGLWRELSEGFRGTVRTTPRLLRCACTLAYARRGA